jgi:hypothetical protein
MSKLVVREKLRDFYKNRLSFEEELEIKDAYESLYGILLDVHPFAPPILTRYSEGYYLDELSEMYGLTQEEVIGILHSCFALIGEVLQLDDAVIVRRVQKSLQDSARTLFSRMYKELTEIE